MSLGMATKYLSKSDLRMRIRSPWLVFHRNTIGRMSQWQLVMWQCDTRWLMTSFMSRVEWCRDKKTLVKAQLYHYYIALVVFVGVLCACESLCCTLMERWFQYYSNARQMWTVIPVTTATTIVIVPMLQSDTANNYFEHCTYVNPVRTGHKRWLAGETVTQSKQKDGKNKFNCINSCLFARVSSTIISLRWNKFPTY